MNLPAEVRALVRTRFAEPRANALLALSRPSIGYEPSDEGWSAFGGEPRLAAFDWPMHRGTPMLLLAALDGDEAATLLGPAWPFPDDGSLLFFHDEDFTAGWSPHGDTACRVLHVPADPVAPLPRIRRTIEPTPLTPAPQATLPAPEDLADHLDVDLDELLHLAEDLRPHLPVPRHRLLGHPDHLGPQPPDHRPLLQLRPEAGTVWGEVVSVTFWITDADLATGTLTHVRRTYEMA
ncbi:hypothetical protein ACWT_5244 [Actinoplanes sp. SE50]|uniref:DUF1963 domain-containing protein n=1 Tax=unclassified Actinoplanes TaxID=2626549 RepID=UPI00023EBDA2|nr:MULTISPECIES: DUF1963 domain-containing protein [unclassified Actinoplanes]AEV86262.1 hypothetical protein ACPL_5375 [Actinoplanes sp. SE50/110]ATO84659.1 hypothetical protein ACWT_5244 [Actinoplanes sp. SE50]SLM02069.1 DUF1963 domain-containing protein [Actinoplanes sp. SE50/110]